MRVAIIHNSEGSFLSHAVQAALSSHSSLESLVAGVQALLSLPESTQDLLLDACNSTLDSTEILELLYSAETNSTIEVHTRFSRTVLGLEAGQNALLSNGKVSFCQGNCLYVCIMMFNYSLLDLCLEEKCLVKLIGTCYTAWNLTLTLPAWCHW